MLYSTHLEEYGQSANVIDIFGNDGDGDAILQIGNYRLLCFLPHVRAEGWHDKETNGPNKRLIGNNVKVVLTILNLEETTHNITGKKRIQPYSYKGGSKIIPAQNSIYHIVEGVVIDEIKGQAILDCGIIIVVSKFKREFPSEIGKFFISHGRLDAIRVDIWESQAPKRFNQAQEGSN